jgi:undecaprenyl-diphosphatase
MLKVLVRRSRPQERPEFYTLKTDRYSFPSGHAARMAAIAVAIGQTIPALGGAGWLLALLVGVCRVSVHVHYVSDVLVGLLVGILGALSAAWLF